MNKKICVVGAGHWGKNHIRILYEMGCLTGIVESKKDNKRLKRILNKRVNFYSSIEDALLDDFDGFVVATPAAETHFEISKKIILSKKPVLIEKPMALSIKDAENIINLAKENNVNVMVGHVLLFHPAICKIKEMIDNNTIGELQYIYSNRLNLGKIRTEENVFWSFAPHDISIFQYLTNSYPKKIEASGSIFLQKGIHD
ncbi:MAG: Gfo/Idh/MocA family protein, partial [Candidatus Neomarinimicrobiota bacterium]